MTITQLLILQILAHLLADYFFQTDKWVESKNNNGIKSRYFLMHVGIVFFISWLLSFQWLFVIGAGIIALLHTILDFLKSRLSNVNWARRYLFFTDQILHLIIIVAVVWWYHSTFETGSQINHWLFSERTLIIFTAFLFCTKPANIIIREIFKFYAISVPKTSETPLDLPNAGQLIGNIERLLTLTFMLIGQFEAVGLLIAAKSILRFGEKDHLKSEYVVTGTLLSFGIAIFTGVLLRFY
jgi:hypothetical protein